MHINRNSYKSKAPSFQNEKEEDDCQEPLRVFHENNRARIHKLQGDAIFMVAARQERGWEKIDSDIRYPFARQKHPASAEESGTAGGTGQERVRMPQWYGRR